MKSPVVAGPYRSPAMKGKNRRKALRGSGAWATCRSAEKNWIRECSTQSLCGSDSCAPHPTRPAATATNSRRITGTLRSSAAAAPLRRDDLRLDRLVFRVGNELAIQHLLRFLQPAHGFRLRRPRRRIAARSRGDLDSTGARPQLFQL